MPPPTPRAYDAKGRVVLREPRTIGRQRVLEVGRLEGFQGKGTDAVERDRVWILTCIAFRGPERMEPPLSEPVRASAGLVVDSCANRSELVLAGPLGSWSDGCRDLHLVRPQKRSDASET